MQKHTKIYFEYFDYTKADFIGCEVCKNRAVDIHHIEQKGMGGSKSKDYIKNLIALCRNCHEKAHANIITKIELKEIVNNR
jgi:predicted HNH restriction endonuclease